MDASRLAGGAAAAARRRYASGLREESAVNESEEATPNRRTPFPTKIFERLLESRTVLIHGEITSRCPGVTAQLLALSAAGDEPITIFIHCEGGHVEAGDSIHDMISS